MSGIRSDTTGIRLALGLSTAQSPTEVFVVDAKKHSSTRWTTSEVGGLDPTRFVVPTLTKVKSFDGLEIPAWVYRPAAPMGRSPVQGRNDPRVPMSRAEQIVAGARRRSGSAVPAAG